LKETVMPTDASLERRLEALESAVAELQRRLASGVTAANWLERFTGSFKDEPAFAEVVAHGRALRAADRPQEALEP
jgi:hypothetical protein